MSENLGDLTQIAKSLLPPASGVLAGMAARWSREAKAGRVRSIRRMVLLDLPTIGALTLVSGSIAQHFQADPVTAAGIGAGAGYLGMQIVDIIVACRTGVRPRRESGV